MMPQERTDTGIDAVYTRLEAAERELDQIRARHDVTLNTLNKTYSNLLTAVDTLSRLKFEYEEVQADLNAARTALTLADKHREAIDALIRKYIAHNQTDADEQVRVFDGIYPDMTEECGSDIGVCLRDNYKNAGLTLERRANELLSGDDLTPSKTEQLASLAKAYEYFVTEHCATKDDKAREARTMLIKQYTRVLGEVAA